MDDDLKALANRIAKFKSKSKNRPTGIQVRLKKMLLNFSIKTSPSQYMYLLQSWEFRCLGW